MPSPHRLPFAALLLLALAPRPATAADPAPPERPEREIAWKPGPGLFDLGDRVAQVKLAETMQLAGREDTRWLLAQGGNQASGRELGLVVSTADGEDWLVVFEYDPVGLVKDDEAHQIDADALFASIRDATEEGNERRKKAGAQGLHVVAWEVPPRYEPATHNLTWALRARSDDGHDVINHNVRLLGRSGVMSVTLVDAPETMAASRPRLDALLGGFEFKKGETYAEWRPGDKVAEYGLTALVAAGAGAAAAKLGFFAVVGKFLAKGWKLLVLALAGLGGVIGKLWRKVRGVPEEARPTAAAAQVLPPPAPPSERSSGPGFGEGGPGGAPDA